MKIKFPNRIKPDFKKAAVKHMNDNKKKYAFIYTSNKKYDYEIVKALSIATIVLASLSFIISIFAILFIVAGYNITSNPEALFNISHNADIKNNASLQDNTMIIGNSQNDISDLFSDGLGYMLLFSIIIILINSVSIVIGVIILIMSVNKQNSNEMLKFNIINAVISLISLNIIRSIICAVNCVFIWRAINSFRDLLGNGPHHISRH